MACTARQRKASCCAGQSDGARGQARLLPRAACIDKSSVIGSHGRWRKFWRFDEFGQQFLADSRSEERSLTTYAIPASLAGLGMESLLRIICVPYINPAGKPPLHTLRSTFATDVWFNLYQTREFARRRSSVARTGFGTPGTQMLHVKNRTAGRLTPKERRQLLLWGSLLILAMLCLMYLIAPSGNPPQKPVPAQQETGNANSTKPASPGL